MNRAWHGNTGEQMKAVFQKLITGPRNAFVWLADNVEIHGIFPSNTLPRRNEQREGADICIQLMCLAVGNS